MIIIKWSWSSVGKHILIPYIWVHNSALATKSPQAIWFYRFHRKKTANYALKRKQNISNNLPRYFILILILVGGLVAIFYFPINIGFLIIPIDKLIFFRGFFPQPPTSYRSSLQVPRKMGSIYPLQLSHYDLGLLRIFLRTNGGFSSSSLYTQYTPLYPLYLVIQNYIH